MAASSPPEVCGSWASVTTAGATSLPSSRAGPTKRRLLAAPPVSTPAAARSSAPGRAGHLEAVAQQAEPGDVGRAPDAGRDERLGGRPVERSHLGDRAIQIVGRCLALAAAAHQEAGPEPL